MANGDVNANENRNFKCGGRFSKSNLRSYIPMERRGLSLDYQPNSLAVQYKYQHSGCVLQSCTVRIRNVTLNSNLVLAGLIGAKFVVSLLGVWGEREGEQLAREYYV